MSWRVLLVDDEEEVRKVVRLHLTKEGFNVIEAEDGEKGIQKIKEGDNPLMLDAIICDIRMPKIDGIGAITYFRRQFPSTPVIVLTGFPDVKLAVDLMKMGVTDYLVKPVTKEKLLEVVHKAVNSKGNPESSKHIEA
jgi:two-component system, chemotaxis family, chemotaxis protein CheY